MTNIRLPVWIDAEAKQEWKRIMKLFKLENKKFTEKDLKALEGYCINYSKWKRCEALVFEKGFSMVVNEEGYEQQRPEVSIGNKAQIEMRAWMRELGLTEASRSRMNKTNSPSPTEGYSKEDKEMEGLISDG